MSIPTNEPGGFTQGDTVEWTRSVSDYPAGDGFKLKYEFAEITGADQRTIEHDSADGDVYTVLIDSTESGNFQVGTYLFRCYVDDEGSPAVKKTLERGRMSILDPLTGTADRRTWLENLISNLQAFLAGQAVDGSIANSVAPPGGVSRSISTMSPEQARETLQWAERQLAACLKAEKLDAGERLPRILTQLP